ncbi:hypothetical protein KJ966_19380 [bacterium]|nr:hypothetical protein [bacterium]
MEKTKGHANVISVEGILIPNQWNSDNQITSIVLSSSGENDYNIDLSNRLGIELSNLLSQKVRLTGKLKSYHPNTKVLTVLDYEVMDW